MEEPIVPRVTFILDNVPPVFDDTEEFDHLDLPPRNDNPIDVLVTTYGHPVQGILESILNLSGRLSNIYINLRGLGYLEIRPRARISWNSNAFQRLLSELLDERRVQQGQENTIIWHPRNIQTLFDGLPENTRKIGCLLGDAREDEDEEEINITDYMQAIDDHGDENLVFVVGNFLNYGEIEEQIDDYIQVSTDEQSPWACVTRICYECRRKWSL